MKNLLVFTFVFWSLLSLSVSPLLAISSDEAPNFPACTSAQGTLKVNYDSGVHGIVGKEGGFSGSDKVYIVGDNALTQCFCATNGEGIQTNWWKVSSLTQDQIDQLNKEGWIYIPSGSAWGLEDTPYLAKNSSYSCVGGGDGGGSTQGASTSSSTGQVLGLAATGSANKIALGLSLGGLFLAMFFLLRRIHA